MRIYIFFSLFLLTSIKLQAQSTTNAPLNDLNHYFQDRLEIKTGDFGQIHSVLKPLARRDIRRYQDTTVIKEYWQGNKRRKYIYNYICSDNNDVDSTVKSKRPFMKFLYPKGNRSFLKHFYRSPAHLLEVRTKSFYANINPILHFKGGYERYNGQEYFTYTNRRGVAIRGHILNKVHFYADIIESQTGFPAYVQTKIRRENAIQGAGFYKNYNSRLTPDSLDGYDYLVASGYVSFDLLREYISIQLGHGQNFIGDGHRSLFLSDESPNYFYLKINTRIWKIHYQNIFAQLTQNYTSRQRAFDLAFLGKYLAAHHLSFNILKNLNIGLFEGGIFSRGGNFDLQYLNPIIFYRAVEQAAGSPDNVILGLNWKWNFLKRFSFYGQFVLDELAIGSLVQGGGGWWGNKFALQTGLKYIDVFGIDQLDLQVEFNLSRPFTYTFRDSSANWTHYNQALAHPLGANFYELIGIIKYQPVAGLFLRGQVNYAIYGQDSPNTNWGGNIHKTYLSRQQDNGNDIGQGIRTNMLMLQLYCSYQLRHNLFVDLQFIYRNEDADIDTYDNNSLILSLGLRWNIADKLHDW